MGEIVSFLNRFSEMIVPLGRGIFRFVINWGWVVLPILLFPAFLKYYLLWIQHRWDVTKRPSSVILEIVPPAEVPKPIRAMEAVLHGFWQIYSDPNWYEKWIEGEQGLSFALEIVGIDGVPHFLVRVPDKYRNLFEGYIYSQYGEAEIYEVEDYAKKVPKNIPNERWDFLGCGYKLNNPDPYPIRTYKEFETEQEEDDEKVDPMAGLMEGIAKLKKGEQVWIQIKAKPTIDSGFESQAEEEKNQLLQRAGKKSPDKTIFQMVIEFLTTSKITDPEKEEDSPEGIAPEMRLSPGERRKLDGLERKIAKKYFKCHIHHVYIARKDVMFKPNFKMPMSYFNNFADNNSNAILPFGATITKPSQEWYDWFWFQERRRYLLKRKFIRNYIRRTPMFYPSILPKGRFFLNTEELATLFHLPSRIAAPPSVLKRVESKKAEAPWSLPTE